MPTNVPSVTFTDRGFVAPTGPQILAGVQADINAAFGENLNFALSTPQGQLAASMAAIIQNVYALFTYYTNQVDPAYASGRMQDAIARIYFLSRNGSQPTVLQVLCTGLSGTTLPLGSRIQDTSGNIYESTAAAAIPVAGSVTVSFSCTVPGPTPVPSASDVSIYQAVPGWDTVTVSSGVQGVDTEGRAEFEIRREDTVAGNSRGPISAVIGAVAAVDGVIDYYGFNNNTGSPVVVGGVTIAAYSIYICVAGGAADDIAQAILTKKGPGAPMTGNTTVVTYDQNPLYAAPVPYTIKFEIPDDLQVVFAVGIVNGPNVPADAVEQIKDALIAAFAGEDGGPKARIGSTIYATRFVAPISALGAWAIVASIQIGSANTPAAQFTGKIAGTTLTVATVSAGTLAVDQTISDPLGLIENGTIITGQLSGTPGGVGTYSVSGAAQTVGGATFTGTGAGTNLTVSAVTGTINIGDVISGTGVPGGTTIVSQTSGTTGGAGVYVTSGATTALGAAITANRPIVSAIGDQTQVDVQIDQLPQLLAENIQVSLI